MPAGSYNALIYFGFLSYSWCPPGNEHSVSVYDMTQLTWLELNTQQTFVVIFFVPIYCRLVFFLSATALPLPCNYASGSSLLMSAIHLLPAIELVQLRTAVVHSYYLCNYAFAAINRWQVVKCFEAYRQEWTYGHSGTSVAKQWTQFTQEGLISSLNNQYFSLKIKGFGLLRRV